MEKLKRIAGRGTAAIAAVTALLAIGGQSALAAGSGAGIPPRRSGLPGLTQSETLVRAFITGTVIVLVLGLALATIVWCRGKYSAMAK